MPLHLILMEQQLHIGSGFDWCFEDGVVGCAAAGCCRGNGWCCSFVRLCIGRRCAGSQGENHLQEDTDRQGSSRRNGFSKSAGVTDTSDLAT